MTAQVRYDNPNAERAYVTALAPEESARDAALRVIRSREQTEQVTLDAEAELRWCTEIRPVVDPELGGE